MEYGDVRVRRVLLGAIYGGRGNVSVGDGDGMGWRRWGRTETRGKQASQERA